MNTALCAFSLSIFSGYLWNQEIIPNKTLITNHFWPCTEDCSPDKLFFLVVVYPFFPLLSPETHAKHSSSILSVSADADIFSRQSALRILWLIFCDILLSFCFILLQHFLRQMWTVDFGAVVSKQCSSRLKTTSGDCLFQSYLGQGLLERVSMVHNLLGFCIISKKEIHVFLGTLFHCPVTLMVEMFSYFKMEFFMFQSVHFAGYHRVKSGSFFFHFFPSSLYVHESDPPSAFSPQAEKSHLSQSPLSAPVSWLSLLDLLHQVCMSLAIRSQYWTQYSILSLTSTEQIGTVTSHDLLATLCRTAQDTLAFLAAKAPFWLNLLFSRSPE